MSCSACENEKSEEFKKFIEKAVEYIEKLKMDDIEYQLEVFAEELKKLNEAKKQVNLAGEKE